jgi:hypothetical protein
MRKTLPLAMLFMFALISASPAQDNRGLTLLVKKLDANNRVGRQYALFIAINRYQAWPPLKNPVPDAKEIRDILVSRYFIDDVTELYDEDATKANIIKAFENYQRKLTVNDSLLVYYAGHGHLDQVTNSGFWIPVNAGLDKYEQLNWLPNAQIRGIVSGIQASHLLIISDSCFSGELLNSSRAMPEEVNNDYFRKAYARNSRQIITSGASEAVPDESEFARMLKIELRKNNSPYLDPFMIFNEVRLGMHGTMPMFGNLKDTGHQEGASFLLFLKDRPPEETAKKEEPKKEEPKKVEPARVEEKKPEAAKTAESGAPVTLTLSASDAEIVTKDQLRIMDDGNIGYWKSTKDTISWTIQVPEEGMYQVSARYACLSTAAGSTVAMRAGDQTITFKTEGTGDWGTYRKFDVGKIRLKAGAQTVTLQCLRTAGDYVINLNEVVFVKIGTTNDGGRTVSEGVATPAPKPAESDSIKLAAKDAVLVRHELGGARVREGVTAVRPGRTD